MREAGQEDEVMVLCGTQAVCNEGGREGGRTLKYVEVRGIDALETNGRRHSSPFPPSLPPSLSLDQHCHSREFIALLPLRHHLPPQRAERRGFGWVERR